MKVDIAVLFITAWKPVITGNFFGLNNASIAPDISVSVAAGRVVSEQTFAAIAVAIASGKPAALDGPRAGTVSWRHRGRGNGAHAVCARHVGRRESTVFQANQRLRDVPVETARIAVALTRPPSTKFTLRRSMKATV